jgi:hypothetical protein
MSPAPGPGGPWSAQWTPTAHCFAQHLFSQVTNFWGQGRPASFHLKSLNNGQAEISLSFWLPHPSEIVPPPSQYPTTPFPTSIPRRPAAPTTLPKRPIVPLFPPGQAPKQRKSHQRSVLHRAARAATNLPPDPQAAHNPNLPPQPSKRPRPSSSSTSTSSSPPLDLPRRLQEDFNLESEEESSPETPAPEILREERPPSSSPSLSLNHSSSERRDAPSPLPTP